MMRTIMKVAMVLVGGHLLFGGVMLAIDVNDQNFTFLLSLLYYYLNYPAALMLKCIGPDFNLGLFILLGIPQWILLSFIIGPVINLFQKKKSALS